MLLLCTLCFFVQPSKRSSHMRPHILVSKCFSPKVLRQGITGGCLSFWCGVVCWLLFHVAKGGWLSGVNACAEFIALTSRYMSAGACVCVCHMGGVASLLMSMSAWYLIFIWTLNDTPISILFNAIKYRCPGRKILIEMRLYILNYMLTTLIRLCLRTFVSFVHISILLAAVNNDNMLMAVRQ